MPKKSILILIPTYNAEDSIGETLQRLFDTFPTYTNECAFSVVLVDNASTDKTLKRARFFQKFGLTIFSFSEHLPNRVDNWNRCLDIFEESGADYAKFLFTGDSLLLEGVKKQVEKAAQFEEETLEKAHLITSPHEVVPVQGDPYQMCWVNFPESSLFLNMEDALEKSKNCGNWIAGSISAPLFSSQIVRGVRFDNTFQWASDWMFWVDLLEKAGGVLFTKEPCAIFQMSSRKHYAELAGSSKAQEEEGQIKKYLLTLIANL